MVTGLSAGRGRSTFFHQHRIPRGARAVTTNPLPVSLGTGLLLVGLASATMARQPDEVLDIWPGMAPGETTQAVGEALPRRPDEQPPATRVGGITRPRLHVFLPPEGRRSGTAVLIFPGGGYNYVVTDKEGTEAADWLNRLGVTALVVHYRTRSNGPTPASDATLPPLAERPLQDGQRAVSLVRRRAAVWGLQPDRIGVLGFSAGGQAAAYITTRFATRSYEPRDEVDQVSCRPDFSMLVYPWRLLDEKTGALRDTLPISKTTPPTFLVHAHNDSATPLSSVRFYAALKQSGVGAELHIYETGGHGYGMRPVYGSDVDTWPARAADWLRRKNLLTAAP
jgi:acetyl esterase/lipase